MDDFGRGLGCLLYGLIGVAVSGWAIAAVLAALIVAGVL